MVSRRSFLAGLAAAFVVDPERALWLPGKKVISIPKPRALGSFLFATHVTVSESLLFPSNWDVLRTTTEELSIKLNAEIKRDCERQMLRPRFKDMTFDLLAGLGSPPHLVERFTDLDSGFKFRAMLGPELRTGKMVLRVESLFEA